jgi:hypothetical protein
MILAMLFCLRAMVTVIFFIRILSEYKANLQNSHNPFFISKKIHSKNFIILGGEFFTTCDLSHRVCH